MQMRHDSPEADPGINLSIATWNVMGLTAVQEDVQQLLCCKRDGRSLDIIVLTETKLIPLQHGKRGFSLCLRAGVPISAPSARLSVQQSVNATDQVPVGSSLHAATWARVLTLKRTTTFLSALQATWP